MVWSPLSIRATAEPLSPCVWYEQSPTGGPFRLQFDAPTEIPSLHPGELSPERPFYPNYMLTVLEAKEEQASLETLKSSQSLKTMWESMFLLGHLSTPPPQQDSVPGYTSPNSLKGAVEQVWDNVGECVPSWAPKYSTPTASSCPAWNVCAQHRGACIVLTISWVSKQCWLRHRHRGASWNYKSFYFALLAILCSLEVSFYASSSAPESPGLNHSF